MMVTLTSTALFTVVLEVVRFRVGQIYGADDGSVWLSEVVPGNMRPTRYEIMSAESEWVGAAEFDRAFLVLDIRGQFVLGMVTDEFDVQGIAVFRFQVG